MGTERRRKYTRKRYVHTNEWERELYGDYYTPDAVSLSLSLAVDVWTINRRKKKKKKDETKVSYLLLVCGVMYRSFDVFLYLM